MLLVHEGKSAGIHAADSPILRFVVTSIGGGDHSGVSLVSVSIVCLSVQRVGRGKSRYIKTKCVLTAIFMAVTHSNVKCELSYSISAKYSPYLWH